MRQWRNLDRVPVDAARLFFCRLGRPFTMTVTGSSVSLDNGRFNWILSRERFWPKYLRELSMVKAEVRRNLSALDDVDTPAKSRQFDVNRRRFDLPAGRLQADELDLSQAYLSAAWLLGLIGDDTRARLGAVRKDWRLRILGAIATQKRRVRYSAAGDVLGAETVADADLRRAWFTICGTVDNTMVGLRRRVGPAFLFYWYDNFYSDRGGLNARALDWVSEYKYRVEPVGIAWRRDRRALRLSVDGRLFHFAA